VLVLTSLPIALKEWAVAVKALEEGTQILIMRKGGIIEETRDFQVKTDSFYLYPTYEHQKKELLKPQFEAQFDETMKGWSPDSTHVAISSFAKLSEDIEITDQEQLSLLQPFHIWTEAFAEERLRWKRKNPLHLMLLRVYKLEQPQKIAIEPTYMGCKSWIELQANLANIGMHPVVSDDEFSEQTALIKRTLGQNKK
jgi:hypothetical protein